MRHKHSNKKHRIVSLAIQKIAKQSPDDPVEKENIQSQQPYERQIQQALQAKQPNIDEAINDMPENEQYEIIYQKDNFKQCKIRQFVDKNNLSPTHSDIDYIDSMENYKTYLTKVQKEKHSKSQLKKKQFFKGVNQLKIKTANFQNINSISIEEDKEKRKKQFNLIQEKINKVKALGLKHDSQKKIQKAYNQIQKLRLAEKGMTSADSFCLLSVSEYLKLSNCIQSIIGNVRNAEFCKPICHKAVRRPLSHQAKRWYYTRPQNGIDPESLIKKITFQKWKQSQFIKPKQNLQFSNETQNKQKKMTQSSINYSNAKTKNQEANIFNQNSKKTLSIQKKRLLSAPLRKDRQKCKTQQTKKIEFYLKRPLTSKGNYQNEESRYFRKKIKGVKHIERQKYDWKQFKKQSQNMTVKSERKQSEQIFEYPWNWIKFQNSLNMHAKQWRA